MDSTPAPPKEQVLSIIPGTLWIHPPRDDGGLETEILPGSRPGMSPMCWALAKPQDGKPALLNGLPAQGSPDPHAAKREADALPDALVIGGEAGPFGGVRQLKDQRPVPSGRKGSTEC